VSQMLHLKELLQSPSQVPGWPIKACAGWLCVGLLAVALPLGLLGVGLMIYIWLILRVTVSPADTTGREEPGKPECVFAPVDGRVVYIYKGADERCRVFLVPDGLDSHLHYAPVSGQTEDITWIDGSFDFSALDLPPDDQRVRREVTFLSAAGHQVMLTQYGAKACRFIQCFLHEGRKTAPSDCIGLALFGGVVEVSFQGQRAAALQLGQRCLAAETVLGHTY